MKDINKGLSKKQSITSLYLNDYREVTSCLIGILLASLIVVVALLAQQKSFIISLSLNFFYLFFVVALLVMTILPAFGAITLRHYIKCHCKIEQYYAENEGLELDSMLDYIKKISGEKCSYFVFYKRSLVNSSLYWRPISDFLILQYGVFLTEEALENLGVEK